MPIKIRRPCIAVYYNGFCAYFCFAEGKPYGRNLTIPCSGTDFRCSDCDDAFGSLFVLGCLYILCPIAFPYGLCSDYICGYETQYFYLPSPAGSPTNSRRNSVAELPVVETAFSVVTPNNIPITQQPIAQSPFTLTSDELMFQTTPDQRLGLGKFGTVYRAKWKNINTAVKQFVEFTCSDEAAVELKQNFENESTTLQRLKHPHLVILYGARTQPQPYCVVMELLQPTNLEQFLQSSAAISDAEKQRYAYEIASGLSFLHTQDPPIPHTNVRTRNVLLTEQYSAKLKPSRLGRIIAQSAGPHTQSLFQTTDQRSTAWQAPELFRQNAMFTPYSDIYSYAMTVWELATRRIPYADIDDGQLIMAWVQEGRRELIPDSTTQVLRQVMESCWVAEPLNRPVLSEVMKRFLS